MNPEAELLRQELKEVRFENAVLRSRLGEWAVQLRKAMGGNLYEVCLMCDARAAGMLLEHFDSCPLYQEQKDDSPGDKRDTGEGPEAPTEP